MGGGPTPTVGPILHSVPSIRKASRSRRELCGGFLPTFVSLVLPSCKKDKQN